MRYEIARIKGMEKMHMQGSQIQLFYKAVICHCYYTSYFTISLQIYVPAVHRALITHHQTPAININVNSIFTAQWLSSSFD